MSLATQVSDLLAKAATGKINFSIPTIAIGPQSYKEVKANIDNGKISVVHDNKYGANVARYRYSENKLLLGFKLVETTDQEALIIHECTHAACDIAGKTLLEINSEIAAFLAQVSYFYYANESAILAGSKPTFTPGILKEAWEAAAVARGNKGMLGANDLARLSAEIVKVPVYSKADKNNVAYNGV